MRIFLLLSGLFMPGIALAHGFGQRIDLPLPLHLYTIGAGAVVALSFVLVGLINKQRADRLSRYPSYNLHKSFWLRSFLESAFLRHVLQVLGVFVLFLVIVTGFFGVQVPSENISITVVWVFFSVGVMYVSIFLGDIWKLINPWGTLFSWGSTLLGRVYRQTHAWPQLWGVWPAFIGLFVFRWVENVFPLGAHPQTLAMFITAYSVVTFAGMGYFGKRTWLSRGDPFGVLFSLLARMSLTEVRTHEGKKQLHLRPPIVGLLSLRRLDVSMTAFALLVMTTVSYDGIASTPLWQEMQIAALLYGVEALVVNTFGFALLFALFVGAYTLISWLMRIASGYVESTKNVANHFIVSLLPIAAVYEVAHFLSLLLIDGQRLVSLASDPFGFGWNIFGTAERMVNIGVLNIKLLWNLQVGIIVLGHVAAVWVGHLLALRLFGDEKKSIRSQYPMIALMVAYTIFGLWLLAQPIVILS